MAEKVSRLRSLSGLLKMRMFRKFVFLAIIVLAVSTLAFVLTSALHKGYETDTDIVDIAGRTRFTSQRIAFYADEVVMGNEGAKAILNSTIASLQEYMRILKEGGEPTQPAFHGTLPPPPQELLPYISEANGLVQDYTDNAMVIVTEETFINGTLNPKVGAAMAFIEQNADEVLRRNHNLIIETVKIADERAHQLEDISLIALGTNFIAIGIILFFTLSATLGINELWTASSEMKKGNFKVRTRIETGDELQSLSDMFNVMAARLGQLTSHLESKVKERTRELRKANKELKSLDELKSRFVQDTAHELKTPLSVALAAQDLAAKAKTKEERDKFSDLLQRNLQRLRDTIESVLEVYKIEKGRTYEKMQVDLADIIRAVVTRHSPVAEQKGLEITEDVKDLPAVVGDPKALNTVIENLVENAIKYTEKGRVTVVAEVKGNNVVVSVADTGRGLSTEDQKKIFSRFFKVDPLSPGAGIGLSISKSIIDAHGGSITFKSITGKGTIFTFTLPLARGRRRKGRGTDNLR